MAITKMDIIAMKQADTICFRATNGVDRIECIKEPDNKNVFKQEHDIELISGKNTSAFYMIGSAQYSIQWKTILRQIKEGDELSLYWEKNYWVKDYMEEKGLVGQALYLQWQRPTKNGWDYFSFLLCVSVNKPMFAMIKE